MPYLSYQHPYTARGHCVTPLLAIGLGTLVEPAYAQLSTGRQDINSTSNRSSSHSRPFLLSNHFTWKAGETVRGIMPRLAPCHRRRSADPERLFEIVICSTGLEHNATQGQRRHLGVGEQLGARVR
jgi:hypothetical protein